jgi:hypothetical protein
MPREALEVVIGVLRAEVVKEEEWVKLRNLVVTESPLEMHSCPFYRRHAFPDLLDFPYCAHRVPPV